MAMVHLRSKNLIGHSGLEPFTVYSSEIREEMKGTEKIFFGLLLLIFPGTEN